MIKVTLEFHSVPEAIIALNAVMNLPEVKATPVVATPGEKVAEAKARRARADKGQKRGEYKPRTEPSAPETAGASQQESSSVSSVASQGAIPVGATPVPVAEVPSPAEVVKAEIQKQQAEHAPVHATIGEKDAEAQKAMEVLHGKKGLDACRVLLAQFGVSRVREIPTARRAEFLEEAKKAAM